MYYLSDFFCKDFFFEKNNCSYLSGCMQSKNKLLNCSILLQKYLFLPTNSGNKVSEKVYKSKFT